MQKIVNLKKNDSSWVFTERVTYIQYIYHICTSHICVNINVLMHVINLKMLRQYFFYAN